MLAKDPKRRKSRSGSNSRSNARNNTRNNGDADTQNDSQKKVGSNRFVRKGRSGDGQFVLYVEGARDREILECWARRIDSSLMRCIEKNTVILGGRQPARAVEDFKKRGGRAAGCSGLIVLDRDDHPHVDSKVIHQNSNGAGESTALGEPVIHPGGVTKEAGLEVFVWSLRHIESYLLVPEAIRRMLGLEADDRRVERSIEASTTAARADPLAWTQATSAGASLDSSLLKGPASTTRERNGSNGSTAARRHGSLHAKRILGSGGSLSEALGTELRAGEIARAMRLEELHGDVRNLFDRIGTLSGLSVKGPEVVIRS